MSLNHFFQSGTKGSQIHYLLPSDIRRLLEYLKARQQDYGSALAFNLANALFQTACRFDELIQLTWADCQAVGKEICGAANSGEGERLPRCASPGGLDCKAVLKAMVTEHDHL
jgi:integrase